MIESRYFLGTWPDEHKTEEALHKAIEHFSFKVAHATKCCPTLLGGVELVGHPHCHGILFVPDHQLQRFESRLTGRKAQKAWHRCTGALKFDMEPYQNGRSLTYTFEKHRPVYTAACSRHGPCKNGCVTNRELPAAYQDFFKKI